MTAFGGRGLFFDTVALQSAQVLNLVLGFATISILGNAVTRSEFGVVSLVLALVNYLFVATASWNASVSSPILSDTDWRPRPVSDPTRRRTTLPGQTPPMAMSLSVRTSSKGSPLPAAW